MPTIRSLLLAAVIAGCASAALRAQEKEPEADLHPCPSISVPFTTQRISINGDLSEWHNAASTAWRRDSGRGSRDNWATVKLLWDTEKLYVAFVITDTELLGSRVSDDGELWLDDAVEVFIDAKHNAAAVGEMSEEQYLREGGRLWGRYRVFLQDDDFHFIVNVRNTIATCRGKGLDFADSSWDADIPYSVLVHGTINVNTDVDEGYAVEMGIPWKAIGVKPRSRMVLGADFAIEDVDPEKRFPSDWCELAHFTQPHKFGHIVLEGGPDISVPQTKKALWIVSGVLVAIGITGLVFWRNRRRLLTGEAETADITEHRLERIARQAQAYIEEHYTSDELTTAQAARHLCVSERYLQMILKKQGKPSFRDMLSAYRVERAEAFLVGTDKNVTEIAFDVGFNSPDTFSAAFRKRYGMSPSEFRKNHRAKG